MSAYKTCPTCGSDERGYTLVSGGNETGHKISGTAFLNECRDPWHRPARLKRLVPFTGYTTKGRRK